MTIDKRVHRLLGFGLGGFWADVFEVDGKAYKLFRSRPEIPPYQMREGRERIFHSQVEAYRRLEYSDPWLAGHAATFYGSCSIDDVIDESGKSVQEEYLLDCCYALEVLDPGEQDKRTLLYRNEVKLTRIKALTLSPAGAGYPSHLKHLAEAEERFTKLGIYTYDASVFFSTDREKFKFIDFDCGEYYTALYHPRLGGIAA
jgi:hypothetical protein